MAAEPPLAHLITWLALLALAASVLAACPEDKRRKNGSLCGSDDDCVSSFCYQGTCLDPAGDEDDDGLINAVEDGLGTNVYDPDSDGDLRGDAVEVGDDLTQPLDSDGDGGDGAGRHDALESSDADTDQDCVPDQFDQDDATPLPGLFEAACLAEGVCAAPDATLALACPASPGPGIYPAPICDYADVPDHEPVEATCDGRDNDCDGAVDGPGLCDDGDACTEDVCHGAIGCSNTPFVSLPVTTRWAPPGVGDARAATMSGDVVVLAAGAGGLQTFDLSGGLEPLGALAFESLADGLALLPDVDPAVALVAAGSAGLRIVSLANPAAPTQLASVPVGASGWAHDVAIDEDTAPVAWVAAGDGGVLAVDVSTPDDPEVTASVALSAGAFAVAPGAGVVWVAAGAGGLRAIDSAGSLLGAGLQPTIDGWTHDVAVTGDVALLAHGSGGVVVVDVSDPGNPYQLDAVTLTGLATRVVIDGDTAWVTLDRKALARLDLTTLEAPAVSGVFEVDGARAASRVPAGLLVSASERLALFDPTGDGLPTLDVDRDLTQVRDVVALDDGSWLLAASAGGLLHLEAAGDDALTVASSATFAEPVTQVARDGALTWAITAGGSLAGAELSADGFTLRGEVELPAPGLDLALVGPVALVAAGTAGLVLADLTDAEAPALLPDVTQEADARDIQIAGTLAAVADASAGARLYDVTAPAEPAALGTITVDGTARGVDLEGSLLAVAAGPAGLVLVDVADAHAPSELAALALPGEGEAAWVHLDAGLAWVGWEPLGLWVVDVSDPSDPRSIGVEPFHAPVALAAGQDATSALAQLDGGLSLLSRECPE